MKTFGEAREAATKAIDDMAEVVACLRKEIVRLTIVIEQLEKERHKPLPADPDLCDDAHDIASDLDIADMDAVAATPAEPSKKPYGQNGETTCIRCQEPAEFAVVTRLRPLELVALTCKKHTIRGHNKHALRLKEYRRMLEAQTAK